MRLTENKAHRYNIEKTKQREAQRKETEIKKER